MNTVQLRVIEMSDLKSNGTRGPQRSEWSGFAEIDRAIAEDRLTAYRWNKSWADPWNRKITFAVLAAIGGGFAYLVGAGLHLW